MGHFPLLFFLKCVENDVEIDELIKREISVRSFFLLCKSPNARASRWVQQEVAFIKSLRNKVITEIELDDSWDFQLESLRALSRQVTVYLSYDRHDYEQVDVILKDFAQRTMQYLGTEESLLQGSIGWDK